MAKPTGSISIDVVQGISGPITGEGIWKVEVKKNDGTLTQIYPSGTVKVPVGTNWELRVYFRVNNPTDWWSSCITCKLTSPPSAPAIQPSTSRWGIGSGIVDKSKDIQMPTMGQLPVSIRLKLWAADNYTIQAPDPSTW